MTILIIKQKRITPVEIHLIDLSGNPLEIHNQERSLNTFKNKYFTLTPETPFELWYNVTTVEKIVDYHTKLGLGILHQVNTDYCAEIVIFNDIPKHNSNTIWEFYEKIGYDYKKHTHNPPG